MLPAMTIRARDANWSAANPTCLSADIHTSRAIADMLDKAIQAGQMMPAIMVIPNGGKRSELKFPDLFSSVVAYAGSYEPLPRTGSYIPA